MDNKRIFIILIISLIFIKLFCKDHDVVEGDTSYSGGGDDTSAGAMVMGADYCINNACLGVTDETSCVALDECSWTGVVCRTKPNTTCDGTFTSQESCEDAGDCAWLSGTEAMQRVYDGIEHTRCESEDNGPFDILKDCVENYDDGDEFISCQNDETSTTLSVDCVNNCIFPLLANPQGHHTDINQLNDIMDSNAFPTIHAAEVIIDECAPTEETEETEETEVFGVGCLKNCQTYFHDCQYKEEVVVENGKRVVTETYDNEEECPNGEVPEKTCEDVGWGCKICNDGYSVGSDHLCKPDPSVWTSIFFSFIVLLIIGLIFFLYIKFGAFVVKTGTKAVTQGYKEGVKAVKK